MTPVRPATRPTAAATIAALLITGCVGTSDADPTLPPGTDAPTSADTTTSTPRTDQPTEPQSSTPVEPTPSPTSRDTPAPTQDELADLVNAFRNVSLQVPPLPVDDAADYITTESARLTTDNGTANELTGRIVDQLDPDVPIIRGDSHGAILDAPSPDGPDWTATGCVATDGQHTLLESGDPAETPPFVSTYTEVDLRVSPGDDGQWLLHDYTTPEDPTDRVGCVPPDIAEAVRTNFDQTNQLLNEWATNGQPQELLDPIKPLVTKKFFTNLQATVGERTATINPDAEVIYGFDVTEASPVSVEAEWCYDPSRDPTARSTEVESGEVLDLSELDAVVSSATWTKSSGTWRSGPTDVALADAEGDSPCF